MNEQELQQKYMEIQMLEQQLKMLQNQLFKMDEQIIEIRLALENLDDIKSTPKGKELLVPLTQGIFLKSELKDNEKLIVNVGANVTVEKTVEETKDLLKKQITEISKYREEIESTMHNFEKQFEKLALELEKQV